VSSQRFDPKAVLVEFADGLPDTIRDTILARCNLAFGQGDRMRSGLAEDQREIFRSLFSARHAIARGYEIGKICGVMDLAVQPDEDLEEVTVALAADYPEVKSFQRTALQAPLKTRHFEQACARFRELRQGNLSPESLHQWQLLLIRKDGA
jgi:hypothetical protein